MKLLLLILLPLNICFAQTSTFTYDANGNQITRVRPAVSYLVNVSADTAIMEGATVTLGATGGSEYLWSTGATTETIHVQPDTTTRYEVRVHCICGAIINDTIVVEVQQMVPVADLNRAIRFEVFPNPANDVFQVNVELPKSGDADLRMVDGNGRVIWQRHIQQAGSVQISQPLDGVPPGIYLLHLNAGGQVITKSFSVIR